MLNKDTQNILNKYGIPVNGRDIQFQQPKITINNYNNNQTTNNVDTSFLQEPEQPQNSGRTEKLKSWLSEVFDKENEDIKKRQREYDLRQARLGKSSNSLLRKIEGLGKDIAENMSPQVMGTTLRSQLYTLIFLFLGKFLAKHFKGFLHILTKVGTVIKHGLVYFGIIKDGPSGSIGSFKNDFISFFGGHPGKDNLGTLFKRIFNDAVDALFTYLQDGMEERAYAIKHIEFPKIISGDIGGIITGLGSYLGQILEAITDPDEAMKKSTGSAIKSAGFASAMRATERDNKVFTENSSMVGMADTSAGDFAIDARVNGQRRYSLLSSALDSTGNLKNNDVAEISQSMDLIGAFNDAKSGQIELARVAQGFQQLQDNVDDRGSITVDDEFLQRTIGNNQKNSLIRQGLIKPERYKFVKEDKASEGFVSGFMSTAMGNTVANSAPFGLDSPMRGAIMKEQGYGKGAQITNSIIGHSDIGTVAVATATGIDKMVSGDHNTHKLVLVPDSDPRPAAIRNGAPMYKIYYKVNKRGLNAIANYLFGNNGKIDQYDKNFLLGIRRYLLKKSGGRQTGADFNMSDLNTGDMAEYNNMKALHRAKEAASMSTFNTIGNNFVNLANSGINAVNGAIGDVSNAFSSITSSITNINGASSFGHPMKAQDHGESFNVEAACNFLRISAANVYDGHGNVIGRKSPLKSGGHCAMAVRKGIEAGGISTAGRPTLACQYVNYLPKIGFQAIGLTGSPQKGDILVINGCHGHSAGHICMYDGSVWISDFIQRTMWVGLQPVGVMFRHIRIVNGDPGTFSATPTEFTGEGSGIYSTPYDSSNSIQMSSDSASYTTGGVSIDTSAEKSADTKDYIPNIKSPFKTPKQIEQDKIRAEAANLWQGGSYLNNLYKKYGNNSGAQDYINYYASLSKAERAEEKSSVESNNFALNLFNKYGKFTGYVELFGSDPSVLAKVLKNIPKSKWNEIDSELKKTTDYESSVSKNYIDYDKDHFEDLFEGESGEKMKKFFEQPLIKNLDRGNPIELERLRKSDSYDINIYGFDFGADKDRKQFIDYYNALVKGDTNTADKIILDHVNSANNIYSGLDKSTDISGIKNSFVNSIEMLKSKVMFSDKYNQLQDQLVKLGDQYDKETNEDKKLLIGYQMQEIQSQMQSLGRNEGDYKMASTNDANTTQRNAQIRDLQNQQADINAKRASLEYQKKHRGEILAAKVRTGEFKPNDYQSMKMAIDKYYKDSEEQDKKTAEQLDKDEMKIVEADKKRGELSDKEYWQYHNWLAKSDDRDSDLDDFKNRYNGTRFDLRKGEEVNEEPDQKTKKKLIEEYEKKYGSKFESWFFDEFKNDEGYYGKASSADFKFSGKLSRGSNETDAQYGQRLRRLYALGKISKDQYDKEMTPILESVKAMMRLRDSRKDIIGSEYQTGKGENAKWGWLDENGGVHEVDALGNVKIVNPSDKDMLDESYIGKMAKATGKSVDQIRHSQAKAKAENDKWRSFVEANHKSGISYKEQAITYLTQASYNGIKINLPDNITKDANGNWIIPETTVKNENATNSNSVKDTDVQVRNSDKERQRVLHNFTSSSLTGNAY